MALSPYSWSLQNVMLLFEIGIIWLNLNVAFKISVFFSLYFEIVVVQDSGAKVNLHTRTLYSKLTKL